MSPACVIGGLFAAALVPLLVSPLVCLAAAALFPYLSPRLSPNLSPHLCNQRSALSPHLSPRLWPHLSPYLSACVIGVFSAAPPNFVSGAPVAIWVYAGVICQVALIESRKQFNLRGQLLRSCLRPKHFILKHVKLCWGHLVLDMQTCLSIYIHTK